MGFLFGSIALMLLAACTQAAPTPTATPTMPFEESALAQQYSGLVTVIIGQVVQKTREQEGPSPSSGIGCPCTNRYGFWRVKVERYLANPQPYEEITYKAIEETTREDGTQVVRWGGGLPPPPREGERAVFFLKRRIGSQYPLLTGDTYGGWQAIKPIEDGLVDVGGYGGIHIPEWVPLDDFVDSIVAMGSQPAAPEDWQTVNADGWNGQGFSLRLPPGWQLRELQGIDSYVGEIVGDGVRLMFDYGGYGYPNMLPYEDDPAYVVAYEEIEGREAKLVRPKEGTDGITGVYFKDIQPTLSRPGRVPLVLEIHGTDLTSDQQSIAFDIFRTVRSFAPDTSPGSTPTPTPTPVSTPIPTSVGPTPDGRRGKYGGILVLANRGDPPAGFDTLRTSSIALHHVAGALFGPGNLVMRCRENMYLVCPYLATSWVSSPGFTEWTFTVRSGVYWHDGTEFTAEDAKFWFELAFFGAQVGDRVRAPAYFKGELGDVEKVEVLEHNRLRITFRDRNPHFLDVLANPRFRIAHTQHLMQPQIEGGELSISPIDVGLVGLGPFKLERYERGSVVRVRRSAEYWEETSDGGTLPYLEGIDYVVMPDPFTMDVAFRTGRLDGGARGQGHYLTSERKKGYARDLGEDVFFAEMEGGNFRLAFNILKPGPWQDPLVRRAVALWIDKRDAIPSALGGFGWTSPDLGPANIPIPRHFINWPKFDLGPREEKQAEARRLMAEAGYEDGFSMGHLCRALNTAPCEFLKAQLDGLGIELRLQLVDEGEWNRARVSLNYDSQQGRLTPSPIPEGTESVYGRYSNNPDAYAKHEDSKLDDLYRSLRDALTFDRRVEVWRAVERYLFVEQTYIIPIAESINVVPYRAYVKGLVIPTEDAHTHTDFATVWLDK